jgi:uncharacterized protein YcbK (DUF882 family)
MLPKEYDDNIFKPYFTKQELRIVGADLNIQANMYQLVKLCLNHVRDRFGAVMITSGYRSAEHNARVGGSPTSQHITGEAVDFICPKAKMADVFVWLRDELKWSGQIFYYQKRGHIHIGMPTAKLASSGRLISRILDS